MPKAFVVPSGIPFQDVIHPLMPGEFDTSFPGVVGRIENTKSGAAVNASVL